MEMIPSGLAGFRSAIRSLCTILLLSVVAASAAAQSTAVVEGHVRDASGGVLPGCTVTVTNVENQSIRALVTDGEGYYRALSLPVAEYEVRSEMSGFRPAARKVRLVVGQNAVVDFILEVGALTEEVIVTAEAGLVNTTTASVAGLVGEEEVKDLPLNGRSIDNLITLNPGTVNLTPLTGGTGTSRLGNFFSVGGQRPLDNLFLMNGVEYAGAATLGAAPGGVSGQLLGIDGVREINVVKGAYSAEFGKRSGGQVRMVTMSGSNDLHGSVFLFNRNDKLEARNYFGRGEIPKFSRYNGGFAVGGPLLRNKLFGFVNFERLQQTMAASGIAIVPSLDARRGFLPDPARPGQLRFVGVAPGVAPYFALWPEPNGRDLGDGSAEYFSSPTQTIKEDFVTARVDLVATGRDTVAAIFTRDWGTNTSPSVNPYSGSLFSNDYRVFSLEWSGVFSSALTNNLTFGYTSAKLYSDSSPFIDLPDSLSFIPGRPLGSVGIGGGTSASASVFSGGGGGGTSDATVDRRVLSVSNRTQWSHGRHLFTFGAQLQRIQNDQNSGSGKYGQITFTSIETFLLGRFSNFQALPEPVELLFRTLQGAWYVQDELKLGAGLTANIGLRHEFTNGWKEANGRTSNFVQGPDGVLLTQPRVSDQLFAVNNAKWLFGPRAAVAWDPTGSGKIAVHASAGLYYNLFDDLGFCCNTNAPFNQRISVSNGTFPIRVEPGVALPGGRIAPGGLEPDLQTPRVLRYELRVERMLLDTLAVAVGYSGSRGYEQTLSGDLNTVVPVIRADGSSFYPAGAPRRNPNLANSRHWLDGGRSWYDALLVEVSRRSTNGLQLRANYTLAKSVDYGSQLLSNHASNSPQQLLDTEHPERDKGPSSFDARHRLSVNGTWELPFGPNRRWASSATGFAGALATGWQLNAILNAQSGFPFTPLLGFNRSRDGNARNPDRPSLAPGASLDDAIIGSPEQWYDPTVFILPEAGTYGDVGRNSLRGPGMFTLDFSLFKTTEIGPTRLQLRLEVFNVTNRVNFGLPSVVALQQNGQPSGSAGLITSTSTSARQAQLGAKLMW